MLSPVWHLIFLLSIIRCCVASLDFGIQVGELLPSLNAEPNNLFLPSESAGGTDTRESSELSLTQSNDQCRYNTNQKSRKMRSKRGEICSPLREPFEDNGRSRIEQPSQVVPPASETPASINSIQQLHTDDNLCPPAARYPVCADPLAFPITPDALFHHDPSRMQLRYCRTSAGPPCPNPGEEFWCCDFAFTSRSKSEPQILLRMKYPDIGIGCIEWLVPESSP